MVKPPDGFSRRFDDVNKQPTLRLIVNAPTTDLVVEATAVDLGTVDNEGRIPATRVTTALGWTPGPLLATAEGPVAFATRQDGPGVMYANRRIRLPAQLRAAQGLEPGTSVLMFALSDGRLALLDAALLFGVLTQEILE